MDLEKQKAACDRLKSVLPHLGIALAQAKIEAGVRGGTSILAVGYKHEDGSGRITASFEADPFIDDLLSLLGYESMRELIREEADAPEDGTAHRCAVGEDPACSTPSTSSPTPPPPTTSGAR